MPRYGCRSPPRGRCVWRVSLGVQSRPHLRPSVLRYPSFFFLRGTPLKFFRKFQMNEWKNMKFCMSALRRMTQEGQLLSWIYRRLLNGFKRGLLCRSCKLLVEGMARILFLVISINFPPERKIRIERKNSRFTLYFNVFWRKNQLQIWKHRPLFALNTCVCPTPSPNSFSVSSKQLFSPNLQCSLKSSKIGWWQTFFKIICSIYFERFYRIDRTRFFGDFGLHSRP